MFEWQIDKVGGVKEEADWSLRRSETDWSLRLVPGAWSRGRDATRQRRVEAYIYI